MKKYLIAVALGLVFTGALAIAQVGNSVTADVPFQFFVGKTSVPAGSCEFTVNQDLTEIKIVAQNSTKVGMAPVITRLSARSGSEGSIVFDLEGTNHYLSEVYMPGLDGFQIQGAAGKHTHVNIKARK